MLRRGDKVSLEVPKRATEKAGYKKIEAIFIKEYNHFLQFWTGKYNYCLNKVDLENVKINKI